MNKISVEELEQIIEAGGEVIDLYFDATTTRVGTPYQMTSRRKQSFVTTNLEIPLSMLDELDAIAKELNVNREAVMKMMLRRSLDEYYTVKSNNHS